MNISGTPNASFDAVFDNSYARLPERFYNRQIPVAVADPGLIKLNVPLATQLGLDSQLLSSADGIAVMAGNAVPQGADPLAMAYAGHQFGSWVPQLGDGRALLLGELLDQDKTRYDIQLKGSGRTVFSRMGDGRAWVGPVLREYLVSEAMHALGIETTRALAMVTTGETIYREDKVPGAILTRVAKGYVRVGSFEYFSGKKDIEALELLARHVIDRHYSELSESDDPYTGLLEAVLQRQAHLVASWQWVGFIHGVMNTDNMSVSGETIDYGPCAFLDDYDPKKVFSSIDVQGRYAYQNQPRAAQWNLAVLAQTLLPLIDSDAEKAVEKAQAVVDTFPEVYQTAYVSGMRTKLGLYKEQDDDLLLGSELLDCMASNQADFTLVFRKLCDLPLDCAETDSTGVDAGIRELFASPAEIDVWLKKWRVRLQHEKNDVSDSLRSSRMRSTNPRIIPRNHRIEEAIQAAVEGDYEPFEKLHAALQHPFDEEQPVDGYEQPPQQEQQVTQTFCGT